jgi:hypothetical protein
MLMGHRKRHFSFVGRHEDGSVVATTTNKFAAECAYLALKIRAIANDPGVPPPSDVGCLLEAAEVPPPTRQWIERLANKDGPYVTTRAYWQLIDSAMAVELDEKGRERASDEVLQSHRGELNLLFLRHVDRGSA